MSKVFKLLTVLVIVLLAAKVSAFVIKSQQIPTEIASAVKAEKQCQDSAKDYQSNYTKTSDAFKKANFFLVKSVSKNPVKSVTAVFGDEAMIDDKWYKVGDKIKDAKVKSISPNEVVVVWNDKETSLYPFSKVDVPPAPKQTSSNRNASNRGGDRPPDRRTRRNPDDNNRRQMRLELNREDHKNRMRERARNMTPEQRAKFKQRMAERRARGGGRRSGGRRKPENRQL